MQNEENQSIEDASFDEMLKEYIENLDEDENPFLNPDLLGGDDDSEMSMEDYQNYIDNFKSQVGEEYFLENMGRFWHIEETKTFMGCLFEQTLLFYQMGDKDKAIDQLKYMLELNPQDNQGARYVLICYLLEMNRLDEAKDLIEKYEDEFCANWLYCELLLDIKKDMSFDILKMEYDMCVDYNPYVADYLILNKQLPDDVPSFYDAGDENEAITYVNLAKDAWFGDEKAINILKELNE